MMMTYEHPTDAKLQIEATEHTIASILGWNPVGIGVNRIKTALTYGMKVIVKTQDDNHVPYECTFTPTGFVFGTRIVQRPLKHMSTKRTRLTRR